MTSATAPKTVDLGGGQSVQRERVAGATIRPGMLLAINSDGEYIPHADAHGEAQPCFAVENDLIGNGIDDDYAEGDQVIARIFPQGAKVYAALAASQTIVVGTHLSADAAGRLQAATNTAFRIGRAAEAVTTTGSPGRVVVEIFLGRGL